MDPAHLLVYELRYELYVRDLDIDVPREEMVESLRRVIQRDGLRVITANMPLDLNVNRELSECKSTLQSLEHIMSWGEQVFTETPGLLRIFRSRRRHLMDRAERLDSSNLVVSMLQQRLVAFDARFEELEGNLHRSIDLSLSMSRDERETVRQGSHRNVTFQQDRRRASSPIGGRFEREDTHRTQSTQSSPIPPHSNVNRNRIPITNPFLNQGENSREPPRGERREERNFFRNPNQPPLQSTTNPQGERPFNSFGERGRFSETFSINSRSRTGPSGASASNIVKGWKIEFDGRPENLLDFMQRVQEFAEADFVEDEDLLRCGIYLLTGDALTWYRANYRRFRRFSELMDEYSRILLSPNHDFEIKRQIQNRIQGPTEPFSVFWAHIELLCSKLAIEMSENEKMWILRENMRPEYEARIDLRRIRDINELAEECRQVELSLERVRRFQERVNLTPRQGQGQVQSRRTETTQNSGTGENVQRGRPGPSGYKCFNCGKGGHRLSDCPQPRSSEPFCGKCGRRGVKTFQCDHSSGN